ncbi:MAG: hypothetical protein M3Y13_09740 [Armatimonadota bacterium]|nr:hypothetical protein [Armatimonadota bacterium]
MIAKVARPDRPKTFRPYWTAPLFAAVLSAITLGASFLVKPHSYEAGFPAFFCFLPMAFYFSAAAQIESQKQIRALQQRIEALEAQTMPPAA